MRAKFTRPKLAFANRRPSNGKLAAIRVTKARLKIESRMDFDRHDITVFVAHPAIHSKDKIVGRW